MLRLRHIICTQRGDQLPVHRKRIGHNSGSLILNVAAEAVRSAVPNPQYATWVVSYGPDGKCAKSRAPCRWPTWLRVSMIICATCDRSTVVSKFGGRNALCVPSRSRNGVCSVRCATCSGADDNDL